MSVFNYIDAHLTNPEDERLAGELVEQVKTLFKAASSGQRLKAEQEWYVNERYREGEHWLKFDRRTGTVVTPKAEKRVRRSINLVRKQIRGIKNFICSQKVTWNVSPPDESPEGLQEAAINEKLLQGYLYDKLDVQQHLYDVIDNAVLKYFGSWVVAWDDDEDDIVIKALDSFDVYPDPAYRNPRDGAYLFNPAKETIAAIKANQRYYPWREKVTTDNKESASDFKDVLEKQNSDKGGDQQNDETSTAIVFNCYLKRPVQGEKPQIWLVSYAGERLLRCEHLKQLRRFPIPTLFPERTNHRLYGATWAKDMIAPNRTYENTFSVIEDYILKIKPKLMRPKGSTLKNITDEVGDVLEYSNAIADQLKEFMPQGVPITHFRILDVAAALVQDLGGVHEASMGAAPKGIKSGVGVEALQAGDDMNVDQPKSMLERFLEETGELILDLIAAHQVTTKDMSFNTGDDFYKIKVMGENGIVDPEAKLDPATHIVHPARVRASMPRMHYQFYQTTLQRIRNGEFLGNPQGPAAPQLPAPAPKNPAGAAQPATPPPAPPQSMA